MKQANKNPTEYQWVELFLGNTRGLIFFMKFHVVFVSGILPQVLWEGKGY